MTTIIAAIITGLFGVATAVIISKLNRVHALVNSRLTVMIARISALESAIAVSQATGASAVSPQDH